MKLPLSVLGAILMTALPAIGDEKGEPIAPAPKPEVAPPAGKLVTKLSEIVGRWSSVKAESTETPGVEKATRVIMIFREDGTAKILAASEGTDSITINGFVTFDKGQMAFKWTEADPPVASKMWINGDALIADDPMTSTRVTLKRVVVPKKK